MRRTFTMSSWDLMDEVLLITAYRIWGYSNWAQIKEYMDYNHSAFPLEEIQQHYEDYHYFQSNNLLPIPKEVPFALPHTPYSQILTKNYEESLIKDVTLKHKDSKGEKKLNSMKSISLDNEGDRIVKLSSMGNISANDEGRHLPSQLNSQSSVLGYNSKRKEF